MPGIGRSPPKSSKDTLRRENNFGNRTKGVQDARDSARMQALCDTTQTNTRSQMTWKNKARSGSMPRSPTFHRVYWD